MGSEMCIRDSWEIDALFDTAARQGFYGVVDALIDSREYNEAFGSDTVPFERFITPGDINARRAPGWAQPVNTEAIADLAPRQRPDARTSESIKTAGDLTPRNLSGSSTVVKGNWTAEISDNAPDPRWANLVRQQGFGAGERDWPNGDLERYR